MSRIIALLIAVGALVALTPRDVLAQVDDTGCRLEARVIDGPNGPYAMLKIESQYNLPMSGSLALWVGERLVAVDHVNTMTRQDFAHMVGLPGEDVRACAFMTGEVSVPTDEGTRPCRAESCDSVNLALPPGLALRNDAIARGGAPTPLRAGARQLPQTLRSVRR